MLIDLIMRSNFNGRLLNAGKAFSYAYIAQLVHRL